MEPDDLRRGVPNLGTRDEPTEGYLGVLAHHAPLVTGIQRGTLTVRVGGKDETYDVAGGFFEVSGNRATVLADEVESSTKK